MGRLTPRWLTVGTPEYRAAVQLRREVLRLPIQLDFAPGDLDQDAREEMLSLWQGQLIVAALHIAHLPSGVAKIRQVAVDSAFRGTGLGREIMLLAEQHLRDNGTTKVELNARDVVMPFYDALGYTVVGEGFTEVGIPHHKMTKQL
ncbi:MAG: GNAT family N-acetyltransferase [Chthonomonas sp.]|nr:GNAT family N-acetyltransferase [Chthonomonas sp.]